MAARLTNSLAISNLHELTSIVTNNTAVTNGLNSEIAVVCQKSQVHLSGTCVFLQKRSVS